jgi:hypothetical protein
MPEPVVVTTYVQYLYPGTFFPESSVLPVVTRDPQREARQAPESVFAFTYFDRAATEIVINGVGRVTLRSGDFRRTGRYYIDAEQFTPAAVEALPGDHKILASNMRGNGYEFVLRCRTGNWQPLENGDVLVSSKIDAHLNGPEAGK